jgi:tetratricopeptide (TPR) repeat protein
MSVECRVSSVEYRVSSVVWCAAGLLVLGGWLAPLSLLAQQPEGARRAFDLERRGSYAEAAEAYRSVLAANPSDPAALFGLERSLVAMNRLGDILPQARAALAASPASGPVHGILLRAWAARGEADSVRAIAERWSAAEPRDETPYREWGLAALARRDVVEARRAFLTGRERVGRADALAAELAQTAIQQQDWPLALREWLAAIARVPGYRSSAVTTLGPAPESSRPELLRLLAAERGPTARRLEAELRARWGDAAGGFEALAASLPQNRAAAIEALVAFLDQIRSQTGPTARRAQAMTLAALAERSSGPQATRFRLEAAQAFAEAGDKTAARRLLDGVAADSAASGGAATTAATTAIGVLLSEGKPEEAERRLAALARSVPPRERATLSRQIAWGWARVGRLGRADTLLSADSTVDGLAVRGRVALLRGDLAAATELLTEAGPFAGTREEATRRAGLLALLQAIGADSLPPLGAALLELEQGDTAGAVTAIERVAGTLSPGGGAAELRLFAGTAARTAGRTADAERLFRAALDPAAGAAAPAAELALGRLLLETERAAEAVQALEHLILTYPESALVPQARRALDQARGAVPRT